MLGLGIRDHLLLVEYLVSLVLLHQVQVVVLVMQVKLELVVQDQQLNNLQ